MAELFWVNWIKIVKNHEVQINDWRFLFQISKSIGTGFKIKPLPNYGTEIVKFVEMRCFHVVCVWTPLITHCSLSNKCTQQTAIAHMLPYVRIMQRVIAGRGAKSRTWARANSNMTDFRFCELQNRRRKCCIFVRIMMWSLKTKPKKIFTEILTIFSVEIVWSPPQKKSSPTF